MLAQERPVACAAVHEVRIHLAAQLDARLRNQPWQPRDAVHRRGFCRQLAHLHDAPARLPVHHVQKILPPDRRHFEHGFKIEIPVAEAVIHEIEKLLCRAAAPRKERRVLCVEHRLRRSPSGLPRRDATLPHVSKLSFPVVVHLRARICGMRTGAIMQARFEISRGRAQRGDWNRLSITLVAVAPHLPATFPSCRAQLQTPPTLAPSVP